MIQKALCGEPDQEFRETPSAADLDMFGDISLTDEMADVTSLRVG